MIKAIWITVGIFVFVVINLVINGHMASRRVSAPSPLIVKQGVTLTNEFISVAKARGNIGDNLGDRIDRALGNAAIIGYMVGVYGGTARDLTDVIKATQGGNTNAIVEWLQGRSRK